jgi:hypothetical protein
LESLLRASSQSVLQECLPGLSCTSVFQVCLSGVASRNVFQVCLPGLSCWRVLLACLLQSVTEILGVQTLLAVWRWLPCAWPQWLGQVSFCKWSRVLLSFQITFCNTWIINNHLKISERLIAIQISPVCRTGSDIVCFSSHSNAVVKQGEIHSKCCWEVSLHKQLWNSIYTVH